MAGRFVTISRKWNNPHIEITITDEAISLAMSMDDFVEALKAELETNGFVDQIKGGVGKVAWILRQDTLNDRIGKAATDGLTSLHDALEAAIERIVSGVKSESAKAVGK